MHTSIPTQHQKKDDIFRGREKKSKGCVLNSRDRKETVAYVESACK